MYKITKKFKFEMAHRLVDSYSTKCQMLHGHSYVLELTLTSKKLDETGMVTDFGFLKDQFNSMIDFFDHKTLIYRDDYLMSSVDFPGKILVDYNPTAENMAKFFCEQFAFIIREVEGNLQNVTEVMVGLWETTTGQACYSMKL